MTVTIAKGFRASGVKAGLKTSGNKDVALVVNDGPLYLAAAVFTTNRVEAAPVTWSRQAVDDGRVVAVILNSGGANACTGPEGYEDTVATAEHVAEILGVDPGDVGVCSTGLIGARLPMDKLLLGAARAHAELSVDGGQAAAEAIMTTDTVSKTAQVTSPAGWSVGGMAKGAGMLAPELATMLVVVTTDAVVTYEQLQETLEKATEYSFNRIDSDGCMSTNDTVFLLASGASGVEPELDEFTAAVTDVCKDLARQLIGDAEGAKHDIKIEVVNAASEADALEVAREVSRSNLFKCAVFGNDPNWGRVLSAVGVTKAEYDPHLLDVSMNGVKVCRAMGVGEDRNLVDLTGREVHVLIDLHAGTDTATIWTNDLTHDYVTENSAYST